MFEELLKAAMEIPSEHSPLFHLHEFIHIIMSDIEDLREEGYLQIIKQLSSKKKEYL